MKESANPELSTGSLSERLLVRDSGRVLYIPLAEIEWIEAAGNYVEIHMGRRSHLVRHTVKAMEAKLDPARFLRVRPSAIVNISEVATLESRSGGDYLLTLRNGRKIPSSRGFRNGVEETFGKLRRRRQPLSPDLQ